MYSTNMMIVQSQRPMDDIEKRNISNKWLEFVIEIAIRKRNCVYTIYIFIPYVQWFQKLWAFLKEKLKREANYDHKNVYIKCVSQIS